MSTAIDPETSRRRDENTGMSAMPPDELADMRATLAEFLDDAAPMTRVREVMTSATGFDDVLWDRLRDELGLGGATVPERCGGLGIDLADGAVLLEEFAKRLIPVPFAEFLVASAVLTTARTETADALLAEIAESMPAMSIGGADPSASLPVVTPRDHGWAVSGELGFVPFGHCADVVLFAANGPDGEAVYAVRGDTTGVLRTTRPGLDATRPLARIETNHAVAQRISSDAAGPENARLLRDLLLAAQAVEAVAGAAAIFDATVEYLKVREQFGRPIGSFQALKHRCADLAVTLAGGRATARHAIACAAAHLAGAPHDEPLHVIAPLAKAVCTEGFFEVAGEAIQLHGGIGFTFEHDAHLYFKRAKATQHLYGHPDALRVRLATAAGL